MPVRWIQEPQKAPATSGAFSHARGAPPYAALRLWPHRSLPKTGFAMFIGTTAVLLAVPTLPLLGTPVFWGILPFLVAAGAAIWLGLMRSYRDGELIEEVSLWSDRLSIVRHNPRHPDQTWEANPHWVRIALHPERARIRNYITLSGGNREVELGAFLSPEERAALYDDLDRLLRQVPR
ncbi:DUF2244 domain-containing protein [Palleronia sediminis]|uniref:DUF2244 domain-containing protein n=1 Tax=Palleronia sediminis TaxID=2547833 RepID=A0A4R6AC25_9RHOB|nr:DUF2244 domain-containing protein [Palleronia sediminis]TDL79888.1 DUF2244 domain-containing protein [Palleronia sediminis]